MHNYLIVKQQKLTLMIPGKSTSTIRLSPGPLTVMEITSVLTVLPVCITLLFIRLSTYHEKRKLLLKSH